MPRDTGSMMTSTTSWVQIMPASKPWGIPSSCSRSASNPASTAAGGKGKQERQGR